MKNILMTLLGVAALLGTTTQCATPLSPGDKQFLVEAGTDAALAVVLIQAPEFEPYAAAVSELLRTKGLTPKTLNRTLDHLVATEVDEDDRAGVDIVLAVIKRQYAAYHQRKVAVEPDEYAESIAQQITEEFEDPRGTATK